FFFQAEDGIRDFHVTGVQTCALPILPRGTRRSRGTLGGVPAERVVAGGATGPHQVLYLHGGGYQTGSPTSHRALAAHLSTAAGRSEERRVGKEERGLRDQGHTNT